MDDLGREVRLERPARRVVGLYSALNESVAAMGLGERLVARTSADDWPAWIRDLPAVGTHMRPNVELVLAARPDVVLQMGGRDEALLTVQQIEAHGIPAAVFTPRSVEEVFGVLRRLGALLGDARAAEELEASMRARLRDVAASLDPQARRPRVFFEVRYPNLLAAGRASIVDDVIRLAGGENCVDVDKKLVRLGEEALLGLDPDVYLVQEGPMNKNPSAPDERPLFRSLSAVRKNRVLLVDEALFSRPGPRIVQAVEHLAAYLRGLR